MADVAIGHDMPQTVLRPMLKAMVPASVRRWLRAQAKARGFHVSPPVGWVRFGSLRRVTPISREWGYDRGVPIDRHYIEGFLARYAEDIQGRVLEIRDAGYTQRFGGGRVTKSDVLHAIEGNPKATIVADLSRADHIPSDTFDCIIFTQTLQCIYDAQAVVKTLHRILKPGGVLLASTHGISRVSREDMEQWGEWWRLTTRSARRLFEEAFEPSRVSVESHGNVLSSAAFLYGLAAHELAAHELDHDDPDYQLVVTIRAVKEVRSAELGVRSAECSVNSALQIPNSALSSDRAKR